MGLDTTLQATTSPPAGGRAASEAARGALRAVAAQMRYELLVGLMTNSDELSQAASEGRVAFATHLPLSLTDGKRIEFVLVRVRPDNPFAQVHELPRLATAWGVRLSSRERSRVAGLPAIGEVNRVVMDDLVLALKASLNTRLPRARSVHEDMLAAAYMIRQSTMDCVAVAHLMAVDDDGDHAPAASRTGPRKAVCYSIPIASDNQPVGFDACAVWTPTTARLMHRAAKPFRYDDSSHELHSLAMRLDEVLVMAPN